MCPSGTNTPDYDDLRGLSQAVAIDARRSASRDYSGSGGARPLADAQLIMDNTHTHTASACDCQVQTQVTDT